MHVQTERLIIRSFTREDLEDFATFVADPEVMRFSVNGPLNQEQAKDYFQKKILDHYAQYGYGLYVIIHKEDHKTIGFIGLIMQNLEGEERVELGYRLYPAYWGKGLATEAGLAICEYGFEKFHFTEIISIIDPQNVRSLHVAKRLGMHHWKNCLFHHKPIEVYLLKNKTTFPLSFNPVQAQDRTLIHAWLKKPHVSEWFYGQGLQNTLQNLEQFLEGNSSATYWVGFAQGTPFAFLITSFIDPKTCKWCQKEPAITLDLLIGEERCLGKGLAVPLIEAFLLSQFPHVKEVLIDPEATNTKAVHVYQKVGFTKVDTFIPSHSPHPHYMMRLDMQEAVKTFKMPL